MAIKTLETPKEVSQEQDAIEILKVWKVTKGQIFTFSTDVWSDSAAWGLLVADLIKHISKALTASRPDDYDKVYNRILDAINAELGLSSDSP